LEVWRLLGAALAAALLAASQLDPNPLPAWVFPLVGGLALLSVVLAYLLARFGAR
jgi:hypothetical protein